MRVIAIAASLFLIGVMQSASLRAATREVETVDSAATVLDEIMSIPVSRIPASMLADAEGLAIIPSVLKGGFVIGARHGKGVVLARDQHGHWQAPVFVKLTGGSVGWQVGVQSTDVILVFKTRRSVEGIMDGKFTIGADAAVAAGPVGREAAAATDERLKAEIYSYCRSRGLFAGVSIDGSVIQIDQAANTAFYRPPPPGGNAMLLHPSALRLLARVSQYTQTAAAAPRMDVELVPAPASPMAPVANLGRLGEARRQLATASLELSALVDDTWNRYLALPAEVFADADPPSVSAAEATLARYDSLASNRRYRALATRAEFQTVHQLLREYVTLLESSRPKRQLDLPPPPTHILPSPATPRR